MPVQALILGCAGSNLGADERSLFKEAQPWGLILFKRNIETPAQVAAREPIYIYSNIYILMYTQNTNCRVANSTAGKGETLKPDVQFFEAKYR